MKRNTAAIIYAPVLAIAVIFLLASCSNGAGSKKGNAQAAAASAMAPCTCGPAWFPHTQTPAPAEGNGSPFDTSSTSNCIFHQWAVQKFLWLTKPVGNSKALFEEQLMLVDNNMEQVAVPPGATLLLDDSTQAGSGGILRSNAFYNPSKTSYTVYYGIYINDVLKSAADSFRRIIVNDSSLVNNSFTFPVHSLEVKTSWVDTNALPAGQAKNYHTAKAYVAPLHKTITVALLGMHVVGVVKNHPEFIWATFEHRDMAPVYDWANTTRNNDVPVTSDSEKLFFKKGAVATWENLEWETTHPRNIFTVYKFGVPVLPTDTFMETSQKEPVNFDNIVSLNTCMAAALKSENDVWQHYSYNGAAWINTDGLTPAQQADTINALGYYIASPLPGSITRGSLAAFNITMETYEQDFDNIPLHDMNDSTLSNCFSCHNSRASIVLKNNDTSQGLSPLYLSHIFRSSLSKSCGVPKSSIELLRIYEYMAMLQARGKRK